jgi:hypothetical protein
MAAPIPAVRARPWISRTQDPRVHGRIADGGRPETSLAPRTCWSEASPSGRSDGQ